MKKEDKRLVQIKKDISISKKEKIKYKLEKLLYFNKTGYRKHNFILSICAIVYRFFATWFLLTAILIASIMLFIFDIKYEIIGKKDLLSFIDTNSESTLFVISITVFGIAITAYSIIFAFKSKKYFSTNQFDNVLKYNIFPMNLKGLLVLDMLHFGWTIFTFLLGSSKASSLFLIFFSYFTILGVIKISMKTDASIYYKNHSYGLKPNPFKKRKSNYLEIFKNETTNEMTQEMLNKFLNESFKSKYMVNVIHYFIESRRIIVYKNELGKEIDVELFNVYINDFFKHINCDSQIVGSAFICELFADVMKKLYSSQNYELFAVHISSFLEGYLKFITSKLLKKRFMEPSECLMNLDIKSDNKLIDVVTRNLYFSVILKSSFEFINNESAKMLDEKNSDFFANTDIREVDKNKKLIEKYLENFYNRNITLLNKMIDKGKERTSILKDDIRKLEEINDILKNTQEKIKDILAE